MCHICQQLTDLAAESGLCHTWMETTGRSHIPLSQLSTLNRSRCTYPDTQVELGIPHWVPFLMYSGGVLRVTCEADYHVWVDQVLLWALLYAREDAHQSLNCLRVHCINETAITTVGLVGV